MFHRNKRLKEEIIFSEHKLLIQKQLAYILGRLQIFIDLDEDMENGDDLSVIISNSHLNNSFLALAREVFCFLCYFDLAFVLKDLV